MKKVLIVTLQGDNLGNRLQNYALQKTLQSLGCISYTAKTTIHEFELLRSKFKFLVFMLLGKFGLDKYKMYYFRFKRINKFNQFNEKYIHNIIPINYSKAFNSNWDEFDFLVTGSDQVWHRWSADDDELKYFYLEFVDYNKRISYAPSFGFDCFPKKDVNLHKIGINGIKYLSCREANGVELIKQLTGRNAQLVLDPTLLLEKEDWIDIEQKPKWIGKEKYILNYFLGNTKKYKDTIDSFAESRNLTIFDAYRTDSLNSQLITPDEFVWLVHNAEYVCTDSFHATVFSLIFEKKFLSFKRCESGMDKMFDRIENIQNIFGVDRVYNNNIFEIEKDLRVNDISAIKQQSLSFLKKALEGRE